MPQAIWRGSISFGMVTIPVRVFSATGEKDISFRQVRASDGSRIRYKRVSEADGEEVPYSDIAKGYEMPDGRMVVLDSDDFADLPLSTKKVIDVLEFVPADQVDPLYLGKSYYLSADGGAGAKPYVLLREALAGSDLYALVKVALRSREALATVRVKDDVLVLQTMLWPDEIRDASFAAPDDSDVEIRPQESAMAKSYIEALKADFEPDQFTDGYREALEKVVAAKAEGVPLPEEDEDEGQSSGQVVDLVAALRASVEAAKKRRAGGGSAGSEKDGADKPAATTSAAKKSAAKAPAKKAAAKKTTAKKAPAKSAKKPAAKKSSTSKKTAAKKTARKASAA